EAVGMFRPKAGIPAPGAASALIDPTRPPDAAALALARSFAEQSRRTLDAIREGVAAREADRVARGALRLRGTLARLGASAACEAAHARETMGRAAEMEEAGEALAALETRVEEIRVALETAGAGAEAPAA